MQENAKERQLFYSIELIIKRKETLGNAKVNKG